MSSSKDTISYHLRQFRRISPVYVATAFVASGAVTVYALRANNLKMVELKEKLFKADEAGQDVQTPLRDLQQHVLHHMNTSLATESIYPPIQLKGTYDRLMAVEKARVDAINGGLYTAAQAKCEAEVNAVLGRDKIPCVEQFLQDSKAAEVKTVSTSLYKFDFIAPKWSPDMAGWGIVLTALIGLFLIARLAAALWYKKQSRR